MRLPQGPWFPWSREFRWDRLPWQAAKRHELDAIRDQRDLAALVEATATTIGTVARLAGFAFRPDASGVGRHNGHRKAFVLYEVAAEEVADRSELLADVARGSCVDLWVYWSPDTGQLHLSLPGRLRTRRSEQVDRDALREALDVHAHELAEQLNLDA